MENLDETHRNCDSKVTSHSSKDSDGGCVRMNVTKSNQMENEKVHIVDIAKFPILVKYLKKLLIKNVKKE